MQAQARSHSPFPAPVRRTTRLLLTCGVLAGPVYLVIGLAEALTRPGRCPPVTVSR